MVLWIVTLVAALACLWLLGCVLPRSRTHWRSRLDDAVRVQVGRLRHPESDTPDPFVALRIQSRLGVIAAEIRALEADGPAYARVRRLEALRLAYDDLLHEGHRLAGVPPVDSADREAKRWREEQELAERGWSW